MYLDFRNSFFFAVFAIFSYLGFNPFMPTGAFDSEGFKVSVFIYRLVVFRFIQFRIALSFTVNIPILYLSCRSSKGRLMFQNKYAFDEKFALEKCLIIC